MDFLEYNRKRMLENSNDIEVTSAARIAVYDDFRSSPRIVEVEPEETRDFLGHLAAKIYEEQQAVGGKIAYSVIKQVSENFIHAGFREMVISILPGGKEIRFSDQGPGIENVNDVLRPGFSTATSEMKKYIDGVGSGLPIAKEYLTLNNGSIEIESNLNHGCVITLKSEERQENVVIPAGLHNSAGGITSLSPRQTSILLLLSKGETLGNKQIAEELELPQSSVHNELNKLQDMNFVKKVGTKRQITDLGLQVIHN